MQLLVLTLAYFAFFWPNAVAVFSFRVVIHTFPEKSSAFSFDFSKEFLHPKGENPLAFITLLSIIMITDVKFYSVLVEIQ